MEQSSSPAAGPSAPAQPYEFPLELRWSDQDLLGHVNNAKIVTLAEEARVRFLEKVSSSEANARRVVARQTIDYHAEVLYGPELLMRVGVQRVGTSSYTLRQQGHQKGRAVFTVDTVMVMLTENGSRPLTEEEKGILQDWAWPEESD